LSGNGERKKREGDPEHDQRSQKSARWRSLSSRVMLDHVTAPV
jgi:hypothetical protein